MIKTSLHLLFTLIYFNISNSFSIQEEKVDYDVEQRNYSLLKNAEIIIEEYIDFHSKNLTNQPPKEIDTEKTVNLILFLSYKTGNYFTPTNLKVYINKEEIKNRELDQSDIIALKKGGIPLVADIKINKSIKKISIAIEGKDERNKSKKIESVDDIEIGSDKNTNRINKLAEIELNKKTYQPNIVWESW